ncbi:MAG: three-Cys-motif partner protein TcmP [Gammaproteobacteria bacterium]|nr:three-Cys-motif partner protein TcmP [Gammaproteobacteria bacterium]
MGKEGLPDDYIGREQAYIKHKILESYLKRLFMIVGRSKADVINFVDCFAGPWQEGDKFLADTSIGIALKQMESCKKQLDATFGRNVKFRALFIEKEEKPYTRLKTFLSENHYPTIVAECIHGEYAKSSEEIVNWCKEGFTFFFVDPKGWLNVSDLRPFLAIRNSEFLVNLMYDFINRFVTQFDQKDRMSDIFGETPDFLQDALPEERQSKLLTLFRKNLNKTYDGRSAFVRIEKPGHNRILYYLVW